MKNLQSGKNVSIIKRYINAKVEEIDMKKKFIGIWGQYGDGNKIADGQAVRTTIITQELLNRYGENNVICLNSEGWNKHPFSFLFKTIRLYFDCEKVIIAPADNGFIVVVTIYNFLNIFFKREIIDIVIGGYLPNLLKNKPGYIKMLKKYKALFVQTNNLKKEIQSYGLDNVYILSNLKRLYRPEYNSLILDNNIKIKVCTLSRVIKEKGIEDAIKAVDLANKKIGNNLIELDIFGIPSNEYKSTFEHFLIKYSNFVKYRGVLKYDKTSITLSKYFAMIFPTYYYGEGFPGNVIDAYCSALPIIATDWNYNSEIIKNDRNGILVPIKSPEKICDALLKMYYDRNLVLSYRRNNLIDSEEYTPDKVLKDFYDLLEN